MLKKTTIYRYILGFGLFILSTILSIAQSTDTVLLSAMKHELQRNMQDLVKENYDKPFFISYTIANIETYSASASLGALNGSNHYQYKDWQIRVMVGDYELNDENFLLNEPPRQVSRMSHQMPIDSDYDGIRRALWSNTDEIYVRAAAQYKQKKKLIEEEKVEKEALGIPDFSKAEKVQMLIPRTASVYENSLIDQRVRELSALFIDYPEIINSSVSMNKIRADVFFINSEGTEIQYPMDFISISVYMNAVADNNRKRSQSLIYQGLSVDDLQDNNKIKADIAYSVNEIQETSNEELFEGDYTGPVLFTGSVVPKKIATILFSGKSKLISTREPLKRNDQKDSYYDNRDNTKNWTIGKRVLGKDVKVTEYTSLDAYRGIPLWGNYEVDAEGVIPSDSMILIENGIVQNKLNGRTPSKELDSTNGHMRHGISSQGLQIELSPGIVKFESTNARSYAALKEQLLTLAKEEGLEYGILVKPAPVNASNPTRQFFKVMVETGEEIRIYGATVENIDVKEYKEDVFYSDSLTVYNSMFLESNSSAELGGVPVTYITPYAMLIKEAELKPAGVTYANRKPVVESPLKIKD